MVIVGAQLAGVSVTKAGQLARVSAGTVTKTKTELRLQELRPDSPPGRDPLQDLGRYRCSAVSSDVFFRFCVVVNSGQVKLPFTILQLGSASVAVVFQSAPT